MKKISTCLIVAASGLFVLGLFGCAAQPNANAPSTANVTTPAPTPDKAAIEAELTRIENDWPRVIKEHDSAAVQRVEADDISLIYPDGSQGSKQRDIQDIGSGAISADSWELSEIQVNVINNDAAVVTLRTKVVNAKYKTPEGKTQNVSGDFRFVDTFARRNGQWQLIASAGVPIVNPQAPAAKASPVESPAMKASPATKASPSTRASPTIRPSPTTRPSPSTRPSTPRPAATPAPTP
jgi:hypothetical protein